MHQGACGTKSVLLSVLFLGVSHLTTITSTSTKACTTAAWTGEKTVHRVPMIWKNRDTDRPENRVVFVNETPFKYLGVTDASERSGRAVFAGLNETGFAIVNSVAYNLPQNPSELADQEGFVIADILQTARSVKDFEAYLEANLGPDLGVRANFLVFDAGGEVWLYEVHNHGYKKFSVAETPERYVISTNFARSGLTDQGSGYLRREQAMALIGEYKSPFGPEFIITTLAKDLGHRLVRTPTLEELGQRSVQTPYWLSTTDTINRDSTVSSILIQGKSHSLSTHLKGLRPATLWVSLGEPLASLAVPLWVEAGQVPRALSQGVIVPLQERALQIKNLLRPFPQKEKQKYLNLSLLQNKEGTGLLSLLTAKQQEIFQQTTAFLASPRTASELAEYQENIAEFALTALSSALEQLRCEQDSQSLCRLPKTLPTAGIHL